MTGFSLSSRPQRRDPVKLHQDTHTYYVYIMSNPRRTVLYIGMTNNLERRVAEHKSHALKGFTDRYNCTELVYFEEAPSIEVAITREKQLKKWNRRKKEVLIATLNPDKRDLSVGLGFD